MLKKGTSVAALIALAVVLAWLSPSDKTLGDVVKMVYVHAAMIWASMAMFTVAGALGLGFLLSKKGFLCEWSWATSTSAIVLYVPGFVLNVIVMQMAWGGIFWGEPRFGMAIEILVIAASAYLIGLVIERPQVSAVLNLGVAVVLWGLVLSTPRVFHPTNPIGDSGNLVMQLFFAAIVVAVFGAAVQLARLFRKPRRVVKSLPA